MKKTTKILIVEDSLTQAEQLKYILEQAGYTLTVANNAIEALSQLENQVDLPDLIITDIVMPEVDGYELTKAIKSDIRLSGIKVILMTSFSNPENILKGLECGANNFITKPVEKNSLLERVEHILSSVEMCEDVDGSGLNLFLYKGEKYKISSRSNQVLDFLISSYETAIHQNAELQSAQDELLFLNTKLEERVEERTAELNIEIAEREKVSLELENTLEDLKKSNQELEQFAYVASHDLQEPLRMVSSFVQLLSIRYKDKLDSNANEFIAYAYDGSLRMQKMIQDLLQYSRIQTKGEVFHKIDAADLLRQVLNNLQTKIEETEAVISVGDLPVINGDESQLIRLFQNLIANAIKFCRDKKPEIHISSKQLKDEWLFTVQDNGIGIDLQYQQKIFLIFQRLNTREEFGGTGIGLAICKRIVERHKGKIWFESKPGEGTTMYFTIKKIFK